MIGSLRGRILTKTPQHLCIEVNGIGYELETSLNTFYRLPEINQEVFLWTHYQVREDAHLLYGFDSLLERQLFRILIKVSGIGPKSGLAILSTMTPEQCIAAITESNVQAIVRVPGVGKKTAERLVLEIRDRLKQEESLLPLATSFEPSPLNNDATTVAFRDALSALTTLGYSPHEAKRAVNAVNQTGMASESLIREALKELAK